jgi:L-ascorbate metabolism protein UlaG (beta-lactamase superfamily)
MNAPALLSPLLALTLAPTPSPGLQESFPEDVLPTSAGPLTIAFIGHGTLMFRHGGKVIHVDPVGHEADYSRLPGADLVLVTHDHGDHLDPQAIAKVTKPGTQVVASTSCRGRVNGARIMANGDSTSLAGFVVEAVPAYNVVHKTPAGAPYHPRGAGNGY